MRLPHLLGNERLKAALFRLPPSGLGSSVLLDGPQGIGKRTAARDIVLGLLCKEPDGSCLRCPTCRRVLAGSHPDVHWLAYGEKAPNLEEIRNLRAKNFIRASESDFKVFVIEQADKLNMQSQNALLKVLEEPASSVFILLCENREAMLQTVRSRCKPFRLAPLDPEPLYAALQQQVPDATAPQIQAAMTASQGVMGRALSLLQGDAPKSRLLAGEFLQELPKGELAVFAVCQSLGKLSRDEYAAFCDEACLLLCAAAKQSGNWQMISVFEYLKEQRAMLAQNPSPSALAGALSAFCARC